MMMGTSNKKSYPEPSNQLGPLEVIGSVKNKTKYVIIRSYGYQGSVEKSLAKLALREKK